MLSLSKWKLAAAKELIDDVRLRPMLQYVQRNAVVSVFSSSGSSAFNTLASAADAENYRFPMTNPGEKEEL